MTKNKPQSPPLLILASTSTYRKAQLAQLRLPFVCASPGVDEAPRANEKPRELALRLSRAKAMAVAGQADSNAIIIAGDQCAALDNKLLGKPGTEGKAAFQLLACSGRTVTFYSGLCVLDNRNGESCCSCVETRVKFRQLSTEEIHNYIAMDKPLDCAGSFKAESLGITLFEAIESNDPSALTGLPLIELNNFLLRLKINTLGMRQSELI